MNCFTRDGRDHEFTNEMVDDFGGWDLSGGKLHQGKYVSSSSSFGKTSLKTDDTQSWIADALKNMSMEDRNQVYSEVHGVDELIAETPELLAESFRTLKDDLELCKRDRAVEAGAFQLAEKQNYDYVHSPFHYKVFLRAERFDVKRAAIRFVRFYALKAELFGFINLCNDITQDMMSEDDLACLSRGFNQILPWRDQSGRCLFLNIPHLTEYALPETLGRVYLYLQFKMIQDEETQKKGVASICCDVGDYSRMSALNGQIIQVAYRVMCHGLVRHPVIHHCYSDDRFKIFLLPALKIFLQETRARNKLHFGALLECTYSLCSFGIPQHALPFNKHGELTLKPHERFINSLAVQERMIRDGLLTPPSHFHSCGTWEKGEERVVLVIPTTMDVLLGRGARVNAHQGNESLHRMVEKVLSQYEVGARSFKTWLTNSIVEKVKARGGRFIKQDSSEGVWLVVDDDTARLKVSHLFRARREAVLKVATGACVGELSDRCTKRSRTS